MTSIEPATSRPSSAGNRAVAAVATARRWIIRLALASAVAAAVLVYAIVRGGFPGGGRAVLAVVGIVGAVTPPLILAAFWLALGELVRLPTRLRRLPLEAREHGEQLRALLDQARGARSDRLRVPRVLWRATRTASSARESLTPYAPLLPLVSLPFLAATAGAAFAACIELVVACIVTLVLLTA